MKSATSGIRPYHKGWDRMWNALAAQYGSRECASPTGKVWQYMCSTDTDHHFRHLDLVVDGVGYGRKYEFIPIEQGDFDVV